MELFTQLSGKGAEEELEQAQNVAKKANEVLAECEM